MTLDLKAIRAAAEAAIKKYGGYPVTDPVFVIALLDRLEAAEKDAARYQWLRDGNDYKSSQASHIARYCYGLEWNNLIDAAMKEQK